MPQYPGDATVEFAYMQQLLISGKHAACNDYGAHGVSVLILKIGSGVASRAAGYFAYALRLQTPRRQLLISHPAT